MAKSNIKNQISKIKKLERILRSLESAVIAYSGGVDSTFLLKIAIDTLGKENVLAVIAKSETYPSRELKNAKLLAEDIGANYKVISTKEIDIKGYRENPINRCYFCKKELMKRLKEIAVKNRLENVIDGTNYDDRLDIRYGKKALVELGIKSPLFEAKITKNDIRSLSKELGLPTYNKPSFACLASRIPYNSIITKDRLKRIERAEDYIKKLGFKQVRVRDYDNLARIEVEKNEIKKFLRRDTGKIQKRFNNLGYRYVTLDLEGYRTGSMNI